MVEHGATGSLGFIVNRPAPISFDELSDSLGLGAPRDVAERTPVVTGGPVAPGSGWILFDPTEVPAAVLADAVTVGERLAVSASRHLLDAIAADEGPCRRLLALGYAGWAPGQLDEEFARGVWVPGDLDDGIVFDTPAEQRWGAVLQSAGIDPARLSGLGGFSA